MAYKKSVGVEEYRPSINACQSGDVRVVPFTYTASAAIANGDVIGLCKLPAQHVPVDCFISMPDLDTGTTMTHDAGFYADNGLGDTAIVSNAMIAASTVGRTAGIERMNSSVGITLAPSDEDQIFAITVTAAVGGGTSVTPITGWLSYRPVSYDD
jgi:hypothetical protein